MKARRPLLLTFFLLALLLAAPAAGLAAAEEAGGEHGEGLATTLFKWINFVTVFGALGYFLYQPLKRLFGEQRGAIQSAIAEARKARDASQARLAEVEQRLRRLEQEVEALRQEALTNAAAEKQRLQEAARREAERILATARAGIESASRAARLELRAYTARLAVTLAERRLQQQLTPERHATLFEAFVAELAPSRIPKLRDGDGRAEAVRP